MAEIKWRDSYSVGIEKFDNQHKKLVQILNDLLDAMHSGMAHVILENKLNELVDYAHTHFSDEEDLFDRYDYPQKVEHHNQHIQLLAQVQKLLEDLSKGSIVITLQTTDFLKDWLINHILGDDMEYASFFKEKGVN